MRTRFSAQSFALVLALAAPLAAVAQQIQVKDIESGEIIETVGPGDTISLAPGDEVRLIMSVQAGGRTYYPQTEFWEGQPNGGAVRITRASVENANVTIKAGAAGRSENIGYRILEEVRGRTEGAVTISVEDEEEEGEETSNRGGGSGSDWAREVTDTLYRAILVRDSDESGGRSYADRVRRGGYSAVVQIAGEIARSDESRNRIYDRPVTNTQRLEALYQNLLDLSSDDVDEDEWDENLRRIKDGRIADVVGEMVRSQRFREIHDF